MHANLYPKYGIIGQKRIRANKNGIKVQYAVMLHDSDRRITPHALLECFIWRY